MNKHTPGPWEVDNRPHSAINHGKKHIAMVNYWNAVDEEVRVNEEEHQANARLIAAAPDMLKALEEIAEGGDDGNCTCEMGEGYHAIYCPIGIATIARAAIAKAKGE